jgi:hypothetical protein
MLRIDADFWAMDYFWERSWLSFLGAFTKLRKATVSIVMSVLLSEWNKSAPTGWIFMKFEIMSIFEKYVKKIEVSLKSDKHNGYFTRRPMYIFDHIFLGSS